MITVAGVAFSITIVALSLASSQYTSRVLRNFMSDRANQIVLGIFVGVFAYCLVVLRTIRGGWTEQFIPPLAVLGGVVLAFVGIGCLIFFIHHTATAVQASHILAAITEETLAAVDRLFPQERGHEADLETAIPCPETKWLPIAARKTGYIQGIDPVALLHVAETRACVVRMTRGLGDFVIETTPLAFVTGTEPPDEPTTAALNAAFSIGRQRTMAQDAGFGIRQIVDVALKALSPGVNDTTTAVMSVDRLTEIMVRLANRRIESPYRQNGGALRVIARGPIFSGLLAEAFNQIRQNASGNVTVLAHLLLAMETIAGRTPDRVRIAALHQQVTLIAEVVQRTVPAPQDRAGLEARFRASTESLGCPTQHNEPPWSGYD
jgi:uncharacterized membrane protein